ncbi:MAG: hypothetical protein U0Q16_26795 [Bryobacteraceae bacterium]
MPEQLDLQYRYLIFYAVLTNRPFSKSEIGVDMKVADIRRLSAETGLLTLEEKRKNQPKIIANAASVAWFAENLHTDLGGKNKAVIAISDLLRAKTAMFLRARNIPVSEFLQPGTPPPGSPVNAAYLRLTNGRHDERVLLKDLRKELGTMTREAQDAAFRELISSGQADFYPEDDPMSRNADDDMAAFYVGDRRRDLMYLRRS